MADRAADMDYMERAMALARRALGQSSPNPAVGAVVVKNGVILGEGFTQPPGSWHAEVMALRQAGEGARGATLYTTLEPCCHYGRTPPCTQAIIAAGIAAVHGAQQDPNPLVNGKGIAELEAAGLKVVMGEHAEEATELNEAYAKHVTTGRPFVIAKYAMTLDGKIASRTGDARWISGEAARAWVHRLRDTVDAIMVGVNTVLVDDPQLTVRLGEEARDQRQPLRIVLDSRGRTPPSAQLLRQPGATIVATTEAMAKEKLQALQRAGAEVLPLPAAQGQVDLGALLEMLGSRGIVSLLVEGGGETLGSFFDLGFVDKLYVFVAPRILGGAGVSPVAGEGAARVAQGWGLHRLRAEQIGDDLLVSGYPRRAEGDA